MTTSEVKKPILPKNVAFILLCLLSLVWGSSFILIKQSIAIFHPLHVGALRVTISAFFFLPILLYRWRRVIWRYWPYYVIVALMGSGIPAFLFPMAQLHIESAVAGIINAMTPLIVLLLSVLVFRKPFNIHYLAGITIGLIGIGFLAYQDLLHGGHAHLVFYLFALLATFCYATSVNTVDTFLKKVDSVTLSASTFVLLGPFAIVYLFVTDFWSTWPPTAEANWAFVCVLLLAFFGTFLSTMVFFYLVQQTGAIYGSLVAYLIPIVALGWGVIYGESIGWSELLGMTCILTAVYLTRRVRQRENKGD